MLRREQTIAAFDTRSFFIGVSVTCNQVFLFYRFFSCITTQSQWTVYSSKEAKNIKVFEILSSNYSYHAEYHIIELNFNEKPYKISTGKRNRVKINK